MQGFWEGRWDKGAQTGSHIGPMWRWLQCPPSSSQDSVHHLPREPTGSKRCMLSGQLHIQTPPLPILLCKTSELIICLGLLGLSHSGCSAYGQPYLSLTYGSHSGPCFCTAVHMLALPGPLGCCIVFRKALSIPGMETALTELAHTSCCAPYPDT